MQKKKICFNCDTEQFIWKRDKGNPICKKCWSIIKNKTSSKPVINQVSQKKSIADVKYLKMRLEFLNKNNLCQVKFPTCTIFATDVHHTYSGSDRAKYYLEESTWLATCRNCHNKIHSNPKESRILGYLK